jgi:TATA-box binding protein (TBP) (component of TFIID and TFIIIB)
MKINITQPKNSKKSDSCRGKTVGTDIDNDWTDFLMGCSMDGVKNEHENSGPAKNNVNNCHDKNDNNNNNDSSKSNNSNDNKSTFEEFSGVKSHNDDHGESDDDKLLCGDFNKVPKCSPIYISTKTKISFLNMPIDIKKVFWEIPIMSYASQSPGIIKKQIKFSCITKEELDEIELLTQKEMDQRTSFVETQIIEHIDNPDGRIKFKDNRKINIGLSKKDILNCRCKKKRAFFNCFVLIVRVEDENSPVDSRTFKEMHIKVFNTGKLEIPGIQHDDSLQNVVNILIRVLKGIVGEHIDYQKNKCDTVLINSNFNCGFYIDRDKLYNILKYKYRINSNYDSCSYPGIQCKFFYHTHGRGVNKDGGGISPSALIQNGQQPVADLDEYIEISFMIFRTGSVLIVGKCEDYVLHDIYGFIKEMLRIEFSNICSHVINTEDIVKKHVPKLRTRVIVNNIGL